MKILVANLGSTSFKYRLFDMADERQLARGGIERIGASESPCFVETDGLESPSHVGRASQPVTKRHELQAKVPDHAEAVRRCLAQLTDPEYGCLKDPSEVAAIGFKAVHGGRVSGVQRVTDDVLNAMEEMNLVAPAHNPPYIAAMRQLRERLPEIPLVAAFETGFHQTIPEHNRYYAIPWSWVEEHQVRRWGFHGASHAYIARRAAELWQHEGRNPAGLRVVSCHLGGSSSLTAIRDGQSVATSMGMSPQTGLLQNNRVGDFDPFALTHVMERTGLELDEVLKQLSSQGGLLGLSGKSGDVRDLEEAATAGDVRSKMALEVFVANIRQYLGWMLVELGGADMLVFTGGIGENAVDIRAGVCANLGELGIELDYERNRATRTEGDISSAASKTRVWVIPTNEEIVVARHVQKLLQG
ncbi:MAG: acetate/propionate family kinase [Planctomycetes bacterium]|nr:acetate/propionate family kinase [Planctomycetota bacterium]